jgi:hypothetical protein
MDKNWIRGCIEKIENKDETILKAEVANVLRSKGKHQLSVESFDFVFAYSYWLYKNDQLQESYVCLKQLYRLICDLVPVFKEQFEPGLAMARYNEIIKENRIYSKVFFYTSLYLGKIEFILGELDLSKNYFLICQYLKNADISNKELRTIHTHLQLINYHRLSLCEKTINGDFTINDIMDDIIDLAVEYTGLLESFQEDTLYKYLICLSASYQEFPREKLAFVYRRLADYYYLSNQMSLALKYYEVLISFEDSQIGLDNMDLGALKTRIGSLYQKSKEYIQADKMYNESFRLLYENEKTSSNFRLLLDIMEGFYLEIDDNAAYQSIIAVKNQLGI